jgi:hypothetical protein
LGEEMRAATRIQNSILPSRIPETKTLSPEEARAALPDVKNALSHLTAMNGIATNLQLDYQRALEGKR